MNAILLVFKDLLGMGPVEPGRGYFSLTEQPWSHVNTLYGRRGDGPRSRVRKLIRIERPGLPAAYVLDRVVYIHVDSARVKNVPDTWGRSLSVIKVRLSGIKRGSHQLGDPDAILMSCT